MAQSRARNSRHCGRLTALALAAVGILSVEAAAGTVTAASCSRDHILSAIGAASNGDTVIVPAGTCAWAIPLVFSKGIVLQGAGVGITVISATSGTHVISYQPDASARAANALMRITGFTFDALNSRSYGVLVVNHSATPVSRVRIDHNRVINTTSRGVYIIGTVFGVADNNTLETFYHGMDAEGSDVLQWQVLEREYGSAENFYFEDNVLIANSRGVFHAGGNGGRYVARYNSYSGNTGNLSPVFDAHGNQYLAAQGGHHGMMLNEFYGNVVDLGSYGAGTYYDQRGGWSLFFYNNIRSTSATTQLYVREEFDDTTFPGGTNYLQKVSNSYYWNNRRNNGILLSSKIGSDLFQREPDIPNDPPALIENREFWNQNVNYNGTTQIGVFCGAALPPACTLGDGAWITSQSCLDLTGMIGPNPATPIDGTLYRCTAPNTWTPYYRPYPYPHPLRLEASAPAPVQNVIVRQ